MAFSEQEAQQARDALQQMRTQKTQSVQPSSSWDSFNEAVNKNLAQKRLQEKAKVQVEQKKGGISGFLSGVASSVKTRAGKLSEGYAEQMAGKQSFGESVLQTLGQTAGAIGDIAFEGIKAVTPDVVEKKLKQVGGKILETDIGKKGMAALQGGVEKYQAWKKENPRAARDLESVVNIASLIPIGKGAQVAGEATEQALKTTAKATGKALEKTGKGVGTVGKFATSQFTGLEPKTISQIIDNPKAFAKGELESFNRGSVAQKVKEGIDARLEEFSDLGKGYNTIRESKQTVVIDPQKLTDVFDKYGINFDDTGKIIRSAETVPLKEGDMKAIEDFFKIYGNDSYYTSNSFLNARKALSNLSEFDTSKSDVSNIISRELRKVYDTEGKAQIKGLAELDAQYAPEVKLLSQIKKDYLNPDGSLKDGALNKIANLTGKGKDKTLARLKEIVPDIEKEVNILKAIEDIDAIKGQKVGTYTRGAIGGFVGTGGNPLGAIAGMILSSPSVVLPVLRAYGEVKGALKSVVNTIVDKVSRGVKLSKQELAVANEAVDDFAKKAGDKIKNTQLGLTMKEVKQIDSATKDEMVKAIDYVRLKKPYNQKMEEDIGALAEKFGIQYKDPKKVVDAFENLVDTTKTKDVGSLKGSPAVGQTALKIDDPLIQEALKYKTTINIQDKNDLEYLGRILSEDNIKDIQAGKMTNWKGIPYSDLAKVNFISKTPQTIEQQLAGKIKDVKLKSNTFYHGTSAENAKGIMESGFKRGSDLPRETFRGGGYGQMQSSISLTETPKDASRFSTLTKNGEIVEVKLKPNSKVVSIQGVEDALELEDYIAYLRKQKIDAVYIGGGEKELVIINPKAIIPTKSQLTDIWKKANKVK